MHARNDVIGIDGRLLWVWRNPAGQHPARLDLGRGLGRGLRAIVLDDELWVWKAERLSHDLFSAQTGIVGIPVVLRPGRVAVSIRSAEQPDVLPWAFPKGWPRRDLADCQRSITAILSAHEPLRDLVGRNWAQLWFT